MWISPRASRSETQREREREETSESRHGVGSMENGQWPEANTRVESKREPFICSLLVCVVLVALGFELSF